ncbi:MAG: hypothetical protein WBD40_21125 [Tepidisphaeraceae bacterium]
MTRAMLIFAALLLAAATGCGGTSGPAKDKANLRVTVVARPKVGAKPFLKYQPTYDRVTSESSQSPAQAAGEFALMNYDQLDDVVVWLERGDGTAASSSTTTTAATETPTCSSANHEIGVTPKPAKPPLFALSAGDVATFQNKSSQAMRLYSVSEENEFDLGRIEPGGSQAHRMPSPGLVELLDGDTFEVVARVYVAPGLGARLMRAGEVATFRDLDPGPWRVAAWHERLPGNERPIALGPNVARDIDLPIGVNALPKVE